MESKKTTSRSRMGKSRKGLRGPSRTRGGAPTVRGRPETPRIDSTPRIDFCVQVAAALEKHTTQPSGTLIRAERKTSSPDYDIIIDDEKETPPRRTIADIMGDPKAIPALRMLKGILFKRDQPYRTLLPLTGAFATNGSGVLNVTANVGTITSVAEWASIDALFDEVFVHSMTFRYFPRNNLGGAIGTGTATTTGNIASISSGNVINGGIAMVSLFNGGPTYTAANALVANATVKFSNSGKAFTYVWRNNVKFGMHDLSLSATNGWSGWTNISGAANLGGQIQFRMVNDNAVGTTSAAVTLGDFVNQYDCSFRARS